MTDPLSVLNAEDPPVQPNPEFAAQLRQRLESALSLPPGTQGVDMSGTTTALAELTDDAPATVEPPRAAALPYLTVGDARAAIAWYRDALGAELLGDPIVMDDGRIGHACFGEAIALVLWIRLRPQDQARQVVGFEPFALGGIEQVRPGAVHRPRLVAVADIAQGQGAQAIQVGVVGTLRLQVFENGQRVQPARLVAQAGGLGERGVMVGKAG